MMHRDGIHYTTKKKLNAKKWIHRDEKPPVGKAKNGSTNYQKKKIGNIVGEYIINLALLQNSCKTVFHLQD
uniref:Uncharacterized protein n=1 Tax=Caenorhabditis japonica TaxID=281687 RepID=A0A8R1E9U3_CAEJA